MKKVFTTIISFLYVLAQAQQPYPAAPPAAGNINAIEYLLMLLQALEMELL